MCVCGVCALGADCHPLKANRYASEHMIAWLSQTALVTRTRPRDDTTVSCSSQPPRPGRALKPDDPPDLCCQIQQALQPLLARLSKTGLSTCFTCSRPFTRLPGILACCTRTRPRRSEGTRLPLQAIAGVSTFLRPVCSLETRLHLFGLGFPTRCPLYYVTPPPTPTGTMGKCVAF